MKGKQRGVELGVSKQRNEAPLFVVLYFFSLFFIILVNLVLLIYLFNQKYPKINGNIQFTFNIVLY